MVKPLLTVRHYDWRAVLPLPRRLGKLRRRRQQPFHGALERRCRANTATAVTAPDHNGAPTVTQLHYDPSGLLLSSLDPLGHTTSYQYDALGRVVERTLPDPDGPGPLAAPVYSYAYDLVGNLLSVTDPLSNTTAWDYDGLNRVVAETNELNDSRRFTYDAANGS